MNSLSMVALAWIHAAAAEVPERMPAPDAECLDAREVSSVRQLTPDRLLVATETSRHQVQFGGACPDAATDAAFLATHGWVCGGPREFVRTRTELCPIFAVRTLTTREYASLARSADAKLAEAQLLAPVEAVGKRSDKQTFRGSYDYCLRPSQVRGWSEDGSGIVVETGKRRSGGNSRYRIEFANSCPQVSYQSSLTLRSGVGLDLVCGHPGDVAVLSSATDADRAGRFETPADRYGCAIAAVYPVE